MIKHSVTAVGLAADRPPSLLPESPLCHPAQPEIPQPTPPPVTPQHPRAATRAAQAASGPGLSALQPRDPSAGQRPLAEPAELGRPGISPSCLGWPARSPSRMLPQSGLPARPGSTLAPPRGVRPRDVRACLPPAAPPSRELHPQRLVGRQPPLWRVWGWGARSGGLLGLAAGASLGTLITPSPLAAERAAPKRRSAIPRASAQPPVALSCSRPSGGVAALLLLGPGVPGSVGSWPWLAPQPLAVDTAMGS